MAVSESFTLPKLHDHDISDIQFDDTGTYLASCALDGSIAVYNLRLQSHTHNFEINYTPSCLCWIDMGSNSLSLVVGSAVGTLHQILFKQDNGISTYLTLESHTGGAVSSISQMRSVLVTAASSELAIWYLDRDQGEWTRVYTIMLGNQIRHVVHLDDKMIAVTVESREVFYIDKVGFQVRAIVKATTNISGAAAIGNKLILSVSKHCRLIQIKGRGKVHIYRSPIPNARLHQLHGVPLLVAEDEIGDICMWNHRTGGILAMLDVRDGGQRMKVLATTWNIENTGFVLAGTKLSFPQLIQSRIRIQIIPRTGTADTVFVPVKLWLRPFNVLSR